MKQLALPILMGLFLVNADVIPTITNIVCSIFLVIVHIGVANFGDNNVKKNSTAQLNITKKNLHEFSKRLYNRLPTIQKEINNISR